MKNLAIVVGHNSRSQGAVRPDTGESEYSYNTRLAKMIKDEAEGSGMRCEIFYRRPGLGYTREIREVYRETDSWGADATIELHFNAAGSPHASGTETFTSGSARSAILAQEVQMEMVEELGLRDRGVKVRNSRTRGRGYRSLVSGRAPAILIEPFFATSTAGQQATDDSIEQANLAQAIVAGAVKAFEQF